MECSWIQRTLCVLLMTALYLVFLPAAHGQPDAPPSTNCTGAYEWRCANGNCTYEEWLCDGEDDCADGSDETSAVCDARPCDDDQYECRSNKEQQQYPKCIPIQYVCDDEADCLAGEDELENCGTTAAPEAPTCAPDQFDCEDDTGCIPASRKCDHLRDCVKGKDEGISCVYPDCTANQFQCDNEFCINKTQVCNGKWDCRDGSDESELCNTPPPTCAPGYWACDNGKCISMNFLCNGNDDCGNGYDERQVGLCDSIGKKECSDNALNNCSHSCEELLVGYKCNCPAGYQLKRDGTSCREIDECKEVSGACSQLCSNTDGTFKCKCADGYKGTDATNSRCVKTDSIEPYLIYSNRFYIRKLGRDGTDFERLSDHHEYTHVLDFDYNLSDIYLADAGKQSIHKMSFNGTDLGLVAEHFTVGVEGISIDWIGRKLYWTSSRQQGLYVSELNGTSIHVLVSKGSPLPRAVVVYPAKGMLFWSDWNIQPFISRAGMDGQGATKIITTGLFWPNGLTIDYVSDKMWWADAHLDMIEYADLDGNNRHIVTRTGVAHPFAITIFEDDIYWTEWNLKRVEKANRFDGSNHTILKETLHQPYDIHMVHPLRQPSSPNPCGTNNGGCSHLCLIAMGGRSYTCACPFEFELGSNNKTCMSKCTSVQFECARTDHKCIPHTWLCDGQDDCKGGEDELNCDNRPCDDGQFQCGNSTQCVASYRLCDTTKHCDDGSDENAEMCNATLCRPWQFRCGSGQCVLRRFACDGDSDCTDGTDEAPINADCGGNGTCKEGEFKCDNNKCIPFLWFCDWDDDCGDSSDEPNADFCYKNTTCAAGWKRCSKNYRCIPTTSYCDGENDCRDNTDEEGDKCPPCDESEFTCKNSRCIPQRWVCDFEDDCGDNSDEEGGTCGTYRPCSETEFRCGNEKCVRETFRCDNQDDCGDNSDETDELCRVFKCPELKFKCESGHCIGEDLKCDGRKDCDDASDEKDCPTRFPGGNYCPQDRFECNTHVCILKSWVCDGDDDCGDGSDETTANCRNVTCNAVTRFRCRNGRCIQRYKTCNQHDDCGDGSDENNITLCGHKKPGDKCKYSEYQCHNRECIETGKLCDGNNDCLDGTDESVCTETGNKTCGDGGSGPCLGSCRNYQTGHICTCDKGFRLDLDDKISCLDVDECTSWGHYCPQQCINSKGSYSCKCLEGFKRQNVNETVCSAPDNGDKFRSKSMLLYSKGYEIRGWAAGKIFDVVLSGRRIQALDFDVTTKMVYYLDSGFSKIYRAKIPNGPSELSYTQELPVRGFSQGEGIAVDWVGKNIYWTDSRARAIYVATQEGLYTKTLLRGGDVAPTAIVVDPSLGLLFFLDVTPGSPSVQSMWMNGYKRTVLINTELSQPSGLTMDYHGGHRLYWSDMKTNRIESSKYDGSDRVVVTNGRNAFNPYALDVFANDMYWTSQLHGKVLRQDKFGRGVNVSIEDNQYTLYGLKIYNKNKSQLFTENTNPCTYKPCNMLCLLRPGGADCVCSDQSKMINETYGMTCEMSGNPPSPLPAIEMCTCENKGICTYASAKLHCQCPAGFTGDRCEISVTTSTPKPTTTTTTKRPTKPTSPRTPSPPGPTFKPATKGPSTKSSPSTSPTTEPQTKGSSRNNIAIIVPIIVVLVILILIVAVIIYVMRSGKLGKAKAGHGEFRAGPAGGERENGHAFNPDAPVVMSSLNDPVSFNDGAFANPMYDKLSNVSPQAGDDAVNHNMAEPLPLKEEMSP